MAKDEDIVRRMDRVKEIIEQIEADEISLEEGGELHEEGKELLDEVREWLQEGEGKVIEIE